MGYIDSMCVRSLIVTSAWVILQNGGCNSDSIALDIGEESSGTAETSEIETTETSDPSTETGADEIDADVQALQLSLSPVKQFDFHWTPVDGAQIYQLLESANAGEPYVQVGGDLLGLSTSLTVPLHFRMNASYRLRACNADDECTESDPVDVTGPLIQAIGYVKASNAGFYDGFGGGLALSTDGRTLAVGAPGERSAATGIDGDQADDSAEGAGAVYVFVRDDQDTWSQEAYLKASNTDWLDHFGADVALSGDGDTLVVGARDECSGATGIDGAQADNAVPWAGAAYVFVRDGEGEWSQQAYIKASNTEYGDNFGAELALSQDGDTLAVGAPHESSGSTGINGGQALNDAPLSGAVYVFIRDGQNKWSQQAYVKASNTDKGDGFGTSLALSGEGNTLAVGARHEASSAKGINGNQNDNFGYGSGAVYVFVRDGQSTWSQQAYVKASNSGSDDAFGTSVALSSDGDTLAVGASQEYSSTVGINGDGGDDSAQRAGATYVFLRNALGGWSQQTYIKASNTQAEDRFGTSVTLSSDGNTLAVGAPAEDGSTMGLGGIMLDESIPEAGAVYVFVRDGENTWTQEAYANAPNPDWLDLFGTTAVLSGDGNTLAVGAVREASGATGVAGEQADNSVEAAGAVYLY
jgi:hypothetical protein